MRETSSKQADKIIKHSVYLSLSLYLERGRATQKKIKKERKKEEKNKKITKSMLRDEGEADQHVVGGQIGKRRRGRGGGQAEQVLHSGWI